MTWPIEANYIEDMSMDGSYLGLLDLYFLARARGKEIFLLCHIDGEEDIAAESLHSILQRSSTVNIPQMTKIEMTDADAWFLVHCSASWEPATQDHMLNHFVPAWSKSNVPEPDWELCRAARDAALIDLKTEASWELMGVMEEGPAVSEEQKINILSAQQASEQIEREQQAFRYFAQQGVIIGHAPADGNCALWSIMSLENGLPTDKDGFDAKSEVGTHMLRQETQLKT